MLYQYRHNNAIRILKFSDYSHYEVTTNIDDKQIITYEFEDGRFAICVIDIATGIFIEVVSNKKLKTVFDKELDVYCYEFDLDSNGN